MHFIDLKWKGIKIRPWFRSLLRRVFTFLFTIPAFLIFMSRLVNYVIKKHDGSLLGIWDFFESKLFITVGWQSLLWGLSLSLLLFLLGFKIWDYFANLQRLCRMIYQGKLYLVNDIESPNMMASKNAKVKKDVSYFPDFYYHVGRNTIDITVRLDGSKSHLSGLLKELSEPLEEMLCLSVVDMVERSGFYSYSFIKDISATRITIDEMTPDGFNMPLTKNVTWNVLKAPNGLISGVIGGGKTFLLLAMIQSFLQMNAHVKIGDPKNADLADLRAVLDDVYVEPEDIILMMEKTVEDMEQRGREMKSHPDYKTGQWFYEYGYGLVVVIIDEYVSLCDGLPKKDLERFKRALRRIILMGRQLGFMVIPATQRPDAKYLDGDIRDQLGLRVGLGRMSADGYRMVFGVRP